MKSLLTLEGVLLFKRCVWQSMHLSSGSDEENDTWDRLVQSLRDVSYLKLMS